MKLFKKIALVLVAAMIVTLIPNMPASAAKISKLADQNAKSSAECLTSFNLELGKQKDLKFYGVGDYKVTGIGWESSNEAVATVDKNGVVTAKGVGSAMITYNAKGYTAIPTTVVVTTASYSVYLAGQYDGVKYTTYNMVPGRQFDFKFIGAKGWTGSRYSCTWASTDESVATVDKNGLVTARADGNCQIVLTIVEKSTNKVAYSVKPCTIVVASKPTATPTPRATATPTPQPSNFTVTQTKYNEAVVTFKNTAIKDSEISLTVDGTDNLITYTSTVKDGAVTITFANALTDGKEYTIKNKNKDSFKFKASNGPLARVGLEYESMGKKGVAYEDETIKLYPVAYDKNGIQIQSTNVKLYESTYGYEYEVFEPYEIYAGAAGTKFTYIVKGYKADNTLVSATVTIITQKKPPYALTKVSARIAPVGTTYAKAGTSMTLCIGDEQYGLVFEITDNEGKTYSDLVCGDGFYCEHGFLTVESLNEQILVADDSGLIYPIKTGTANVKVTFVNTDGYTTTATQVGTFAVTVAAARYLASVQATYKTNQGNNRLSSKPGADDYNVLTVTYTFKDQFGNAIKPENIDDYTWSIMAASVDVSAFMTIDESKFRTKGIVTFTVDENIFTGSFENKSALTFTVTPTFYYNMAYNPNSNGYTIRGQGISVYNVDYNGTENFVTIWDADSVAGLGAAEGSDVLTVSGMVVRTVGGAYADSLPISGNYSVIKDLSGASLAPFVNNVYCDVTLTGTGGSKNLKAENCVSFNSSEVTVKVREAMDFSSPEAIEKSCAALKSIGSVSVKIVFYKVVPSGTSYQKKNIGTLSTQLTNKDASSSVSVTLPTDRTVEFLPNSEVDWMDWIIENCTISITNGLTGKTTTIKNAEDWAKLEGVQYKVDFTPVANDRATSAFCRKVTFYLPDKSGSAYVSVEAYIGASVRLKTTY